ncbi:MAG TPA: MmcQ/YjbR family DNA-binding protein [Dehalococcoidia bacterium]|nr:MmcQ/YjbR family DNA-binding protein [Dehalococcoidia bacterium]
MPLSFDDVTRLATHLPGVTVGTSYGAPALRVGKRFMARLWEDGEVLVLKPVEDIEQRFLMETRPDVFFKTHHYEGYDAILIHLSTVDEETLSDLLQQCWRRLATKTQLRAKAAAK